MTQQRSPWPTAPLPFQAGLDSLDQGVSIFDGELRLVAWNRRFVELLGLPETVVGPGARFADLVRFATGRRVEVMLHCPAAHMQLKEARTHARWPGESTVRPLSDLADRLPRLADLERAYRDLWKFYVFADASEPNLLRKVQELAMAEFPGAKNAYRIEDANV